jgi:hypothetical protein
VVVVAGNVVVVVVGNVVVAGNVVVVVGNVVVVVAGNVVVVVVVVVGGTPLARAAMSVAVSATPRMVALSIAPRKSSSAASGTASF